MEAQGGPWAAAADDPPEHDKRKTAKVVSDQAGDTQHADELFYKPYTKPSYKRVFPDNAVSAEFTVFVESANGGDKLGNKNPLLLASLFKNEIKGVTGIKRINANKVGVSFKLAIHANNFLKNDDFMKKNELKAYIPARAVETIGVLRFVPTSISNEELFKKLSSTYEIVGVRRFTRKVNGELKPYGSVSVTFLTNSLPDYVYLDIFRFKVSI